MPGIGSNRIANQDRRQFMRPLIPKKRKKKTIKIKSQNNAHFKIQNELRKLLEKIRPRSMKPVHEVGTGTDYIFAGKRIDFKFCFGELGENTIKVRMRENELLNNSDWSMICNQKGETLIINTSKIRDYVKMNASLMKKNVLLIKDTYTVHKLNLSKMLGDVKFDRNLLSAKSLLKSLKKMNRKEIIFLIPRQMGFNSRPPKNTLKKTASLLANWRTPPDRRIAPRTNRK
ncbi:MAG: hypothetical protein WCI04_04805 [archaeon]